MAKAIIKPIGIIALILSLILGSLALFNYWQQRRTTELQIKQDEQSNQRQEEFQQILPFLKDLPLINNNYFVYFSQTDQSIKVIFKAEADRDLIDFKADYHEEIEQKLQDIGVDLDKYSIGWQVRSVL